MGEKLSLKTRREFLRTTLLGGALSWTVPAFVAETFSSLGAHAAESAVPVATGKDATVLVVLHLAGGNDGLNTVVPLGNDHYFRARPTLGHKPEALLKLSDAVGLHPSLTGLHDLYDRGQLAVVQGVGYPNPNRSHFRSTDIWVTGSDADEVEQYGWVGRYFDNACPGADPTVGVAVAREMPLAFAARTPKAICLDSPESYRFALQRAGDAPGAAFDQALRRLNRPAEGTAGAPGAGVLDFLERTALDAQVSADKIQEVSGRPPTQAAYPNGPLGQSLRLVSRLIAGGLPTRVYYLSQGGYDTHTNQIPTQARLLQELGDAVKAFSEDLKAQGNLERVVLMTFSEFGRRVEQNANAGTDHGAAAPLFVVGGRVKPGVYGAYPSLAPDDLLRGDLKHTVDFRSVYATLLERWLGTPGEPILGRRFELLPIV